MNPIFYISREYKDLIVFIWSWWIWPKDKRKELTFFLPINTQRMHEWVQTTHEEGERDMTKTKKPIVNNPTLETLKHTLNKNNLFLHLFEIQKCPGKTPYEPIYLNIKHSHQYHVLNAWLIYHLNLWHLPYYSTILSYLPLRFLFSFALYIRPRSEFWSLFETIT